MAFDEKGNTVIVNPKLMEKHIGIPDNYVIASIISKIGHEARHAWQVKNHQFQENYKPVGKIGKVYMLQPSEQDAFAFEEAVLKIILGRAESEIDFENEEKYAKEIHKMANDLYTQYNECVLALM